MSLASGGGADQTLVHWAGLPGAREYRLDVIDLDTNDTIAQAGPLTDPECSLQIEGVAEDHRIGAALWWRGRRFGRWQRYGPPGTLQHGGGAAALPPGWHSASAVNHVRVRDIELARAVQDEVVLGPPAPSWERFDPTHQLRARYTPWTGEAWGTPSEWVPAPVELQLGPRIAREPPPDPALLLLFSIDTEGGVHRMRDPDPRKAVELLVFGGEQRLGIDLHMDVLEHFGARGCFFLDVLMELSFGREALERVVEAVATRGHELQLHVHGEHLERSGDERLRRLAGALGRDDPVAFRELMERAIELFERRVGHRPLAYRAGGYRIADAHLQVLAELSIAIDSSVQTYFQSRVSPALRGHTQPWRIGELLELPPSWYLHQTRGAPEIPYACAPIVGGTSAACITGLPAGPGPEPRVATYVSHSFQFLRAERCSDPGFRAEWLARLSERIGGEEAGALAPSEGATFTLNDPVRDEEMLGSAVRVLRAVAERPDAGFTTYAELHALATEHGWWHEPPVSAPDPVPVFDAARGRCGVRALRALPALGHGGGPTAAVAVAVDAASGSADPVERLLGLAGSCPPADLAVVLTGDGAGDPDAGDEVPVEAGLADEARPAAGCAPGGARLLWAIGHFEALAPAALASAARDAYALLAPGSDALVHVAGGGRSEPDAVLRALAAAGFAAVAVRRHPGGIAARLARPFDVRDIERLAARR